MLSAIFERFFVDTMRSRDVTENRYGAARLGWARDAWDRAQVFVDGPEVMIGHLLEAGPWLARC
jgi:hypothetical protein